MKTKADGVPKAFERYSNQEIELILTLPPTYKNVKNLAKALGRTEDAIFTIYYMAYSGKWLKSMSKEMQPYQDNVVTKVTAAKKKLGIFIGHES